jgi:3-deoxy-manno-octulosonate cytidylyltransferase (CMP-KDO synthetase)
MSDPTAPRGTAIRTLVVIPARYASTRFPGKALADLGGRPLVTHVVERALRAGADRVVVATDDERIAAAVRGTGAEAVLTPSDLPSGTDRIAEALRAAPSPDDRPDDIVVNVQGDEPFVEPELIRDVAARLAGDAAADMATAATEATAEERGAASAVKVVLARDGSALYFSRAPIPADGPGGGAGAPTLRHLGLYAYRRAFLERFVSWPPGELERKEGLEQLRALENGARIVVLVRPTASIGVDTPADLERARRRLAGGERSGGGE